MAPKRFITLAIIAVGASALAVLSLRHRSAEVHVLMPLTYARQLRAGTPVYLGGVNIGRVERVPREGLISSDVVLELNTPVARDSQVSLAQHGLLSDLSLDIKPGVDPPIESKGELHFVLPVQGAIP